MTNMDISAAFIGRIFTKLFYLCASTFDFDSFTNLSVESLYDFPSVYRIKFGNSNLKKKLEHLG